MQPKGQTPPASTPTQPATQPEPSKGKKGKGGKSTAKGAGKPTTTREEKTVALPPGTFNVKGIDLPVRSQLVLGAPGVALAQDSAAVLQDFRRLQSSSHTQLLVTSSRGKKPDELPEPVLEGLELLITEGGKTRTALLSAYVWHLAGPKAKVTQEARVIDMGPATTITVKLNPTTFLRQEGREPPKQYTVKTMRQFIKLVDPQLDLKIQDIWQPATLAHDDAFIIRIAKDNAHQALNRLTRHGFATTPQRSWQEDTGVIWLQDRAYADATRAATQTLMAIPEENDWRKDSSLFLKQGTQRATYGLRIPKDYMDLGRAAAGLDNTKAHVLTGCSHKWSKQDVEKVLQLLHWEAKPQRPMGKYTWLIRATHPPQQDRYLMQCEHERLNLVVKPYAPPGQPKAKQDLGEARLMQETSWANVVKGDARLSVAHSPTKLRMDWGDIQDSDEDSIQEAQENNHQDQDDMDDGPDSRKRTDRNTSPRDGEAEHELKHSKRARIKETEADKADSRLQALVQDLTMQNAQQQKRIDELLGQIQALVAQVQALSGQMKAQPAKEEPKVEPTKPQPGPTLDQLRELQEDDGSITVTDPTTQEQINYVLLPEESEVCVIAFLGPMRTHSSNRPNSSPSVGRTTSASGAALRRS
eukprot:2390119-Amphidinium_carterae.2